MKSCFVIQYPSRVTVCYECEYCCQPRYIIFSIDFHKPHVFSIDALYLYIYFSLFVLYLAHGQRGSP